MKQYLSEVFDTADRTYIGVPKGSTYILPEDIVILYARQSALAELDFRCPDVAGDNAHKQACVVLQQIEIEQDHQDYLFQQQQSQELKS